MKYVSDSYLDICDYNMTYNISNNTFLRCVVVLLTQVVALCRRRHPTEGGRGARAHRPRRRKDIRTRTGRLGYITQHFVLFVYN